MADEKITYEQYLASLPEERRVEIEKVWASIRDSIPEGYVEGISPRFLTFNAGSEGYVALANQKNYISLYLMAVYTYPEMDAKLKASSRKLKRGKSCINFTRADELPMDVIGEIVGATTAEAYLQHIHQVRAQSRKK